MNVANKTGSIRLRDSGSGLLTATTPYTGDGLGTNEGQGSRNTSGRMENSFNGYSRNSFQDQFNSDTEPHRRWNFIEQSVPPVTPSRPLNHGFDEGNRFLGSPQRSKPPGMHNSSSNNNVSGDFSYMLVSWVY